MKRKKMKIEDLEARWELLLEDIVVPDEHAMTVEHMWDLLEWAGETMGALGDLACTARDAASQVSCVEDEVSGLAEFMVTVKDKATKA